MKPLIASKNNVATAKYLFPALRTLVAPIFPEPIDLISFPLNNLVRINKDLKMMMR